MSAPQIFTSRYFNYDLLGSGMIVPVRISMFDPRRLLGELPYQLRYSLRSLQPEREMIGKYPKFSGGMWRKLSSVGIEKIAHQLAAISEREEGRPLALCCYEDITETRGHRCHRVTISAWWLEVTGWCLEEITNEGEVLALHQLHRQVRRVVPA